MIIETVDRWLKENSKSIEVMYRKLHDLAEVSWKEVQTTSFLCQELDKLGISYQTFVDQTGVVAVWDEGVEGPNVALRADMDALYQNVDGEWKANHSCGHDAHMTMVLLAIRCLKEIGFTPEGRLIIIFQPSEETGEGAKSLIQKGVVDEVDNLLGIHLRPIHEMPFGKASAAIYHGSTVQMTGRIRGVQAHAARPNLGINVVDSLAAIITAVNAVKADPTIPMSAKVTRVRAGGDNLNIIPDEAHFGIDLRAQTNEAMDDLINRVEQAVVRAGEANGAYVEIEITSRTVAAIPNPFMECIVRDVISEVLGSDAVSPPPVTPGGEDFHFYCIERQNIAATMVGLGTDLMPGLHHPKMEFNLASLQHGIAILTVATTKLFTESRKKNCHLILK